MYIRAGSIEEATERAAGVAKAYPYIDRSSFMAICLPENVFGKLSCDSIGGTGSSPASKGEDLESINTSLLIDRLWCFIGSVISHSC